MTEADQGRIVKIRAATYVPRLRVGAISAVAERAVNSLMPVLYI